LQIGIKRQHEKAFKYRSEDKSIVYRTITHHCVAPRTFPTRSRLTANGTLFRRLAPYKTGLSFLQSPDFGSLLFKGGGTRRV